MPDSKESKDTKDFEEIIERLEEIAHALEGGDARLEEALTLFEEGISLSKMGSKKLNEAERRLEILLENDTSVEFEDSGARQ